MSAQHGMPRSRAGYSHTIGEQMTRTMNSWTAFTCSQILALLLVAHTAGAQAQPAVSKADGFSIGVFAASRAFQSTVDGEKGDMIYGRSFGGVIHGGFSEHSGIGFRLQAGSLDVDALEPSFAQADLTYRYTFRQQTNTFRPFFDIGVAGYAERTSAFGSTFDQRGSFVTLALGGQLHFNQAVALELVWSAAGGRLYESKLNDSSIDVADNTVGAGGLSLGLVWHPTSGRNR